MNKKKTKWLVALVLLLVGLFFLWAQPPKNALPCIPASPALPVITCQLHEGALKVVDVEAKEII